MNTVGENLEASKISCITAAVKQHEEACTDAQTHHACITC